MICPNESLPILYLSRKRSATPSTEERPDPATPSGAATAHSAEPGGAASSAFAVVEPGGAATSVASSQGTRRSRVRPAKLKDFV